MTGFSYRVTADGRVFITRSSRTVRVVAGESGRRLAAELADADADRRQHFLAAASGNYPRGTER